MHFFRTNNLAVAVISRNLESTVQRAFGRGTNPTNIPSGVQSSILSTCKDNLVQTRIQKENRSALPISLSQKNKFNTKKKKKLQNKQLVRYSINSFLLLNQLIDPPQISSPTLTNKIDNFSSKKILFDLSDQILNERKKKKEKENGKYLKKIQKENEKQKHYDKILKDKNKKENKNQKQKQQKKQKQIIYQYANQKNNFLYKPEISFHFSNLLLVKEILKQLYSMGNIGLKNSNGVSCYKNASFQCLLKTPLIMIRGNNLKTRDKKKNKKSLTNQDINQENKLQELSEISVLPRISRVIKFSFNLNSKIRLVESFKNLVEKYRSTNENGVVDPQFVDHALRSICPVFDLKKQQDAHEFITFVIDALAEETKDHNNQSFVSDLFSGQLEISLTCLKCKNCIYFTELIHNISLPLVIRKGFSQNNNNRKEKNKKNCKNKLETKVLKKKTVSSRNLKSNRKGKNYKKKIKIIHCFEKFFTKTLLQGENSVWCSKCKQKTNHSHQYNFDVFPKILIIHLLRFNEKFQKNDIHVSFPISDLDISFTSKNNHTTNPKRSTNKQKYNLIGVIQHIGSTMFGHYKSITFDRKIKKFFSFNDSIVKPVTNKKKIFENAYILFYERKEVLY
ncbi:ubiquitin carboxyl-terminal hydrolase [Anaeramoeba flamelloides]|uniref:Ubiquitin carboxyl-terminal hydrolase n=1 Tax=Anaeramoeba flamelloides TaxID=1746091 RepID=A0ABQ8Y5V0_9EUKA|nr:ubiquitin carboxyl-terminal hydrolase [Anaeramoeba flamelloides]